MIERIFYLQRELTHACRDSRQTLEKINRKYKELAERVAENMRIESVEPYTIRLEKRNWNLTPDLKFPTLEPKSLLVGQHNWSHEIAFFLSNDPLVNIDYHLDSFDYVNDGVKGTDISRRGLTDYNWVYWALKSGRPVHSVLARFEQYAIYPTGKEEEGCSIVPKGSLDRFKAYCLESDGHKDIKVRFDRCNNGKAATVNLEDVQRLEKIKSMRKQISVDLDFISEYMSGAPDHHLMPGISKEELKRIIGLCAGENDVYDVWQHHDKSASVIAELFM